MVTARLLLYSAILGRGHTALLRSRWLDTHLNDLAVYGNENNNIYDIP